VQVKGENLESAADFVNSIPIATLIVDNKGRVRRVNEAFENVFGTQRSTVEGLNWRKFLSVDEQCKLLQAWQSWSTQVNVDITIRPEYGDCAVSLRACPLDESQDFWVVVLENITGIRWQAEHLQHLQHFSEKLAESSPDVMYVYDIPSSKATWCNRMVSTLGVTREEVLTRSGVIFEHIHPDDLPAVIAHHTQLAASENDQVFEIEYRWMVSDGRVLWLHSRDQVFERSEGGSVKTIVGSAVDITARKDYEEMLEQYMMQSEQQRVELELSRDMLEKANLQLAEFNAKLEELSLTDPLTNVSNRRALDNFLKKQFDLAARHGRPLSLVLMDIDKFKLLNDDFGHQVGDEVLWSVAKILADSARATDFVARFGGEEFVVVLTESDCGAASIAAERFRSAIEQAEWSYRPVTASFGYSSTTTARNVEELIAQADEALYAAKKGGRNQCRAYTDIPQAAA